MNLVMARAKNAWLLAFADVVTLLITFFIMTIALHKGEITKLQRWSEQQITQSYQQMQTLVEEDGLDSVMLTRNARGIVLTLNTDQSFDKAGFTPSPEVVLQLQQLAKVLAQMPLFDWHNNPAMKAVINKAQQGGFQWWAEINIEGHTDNDAINPLSRLRNNFFLSTLRAQNVMQILYQNSGLPSDVFSVSGFGAWQPLLDNDSEMAKAKNRRVEIVINASFQQALVDER